MTAKHIISVDPGDVNNGFCYFKYDTETEKADLKIMKICGARELSDLLKVLWGIGQVPNESKPDKNPNQMYFVIENFRVDSMGRGAIFQWNQMLTSQMIGRVKLCAEWLDAPVFMQEPAILAQGKRIVKGKVPLPKGNGHLRDDVSAFIHGTHFMVSKNLIRTVDDISMFGQESI